MTLLRRSLYVTPLSEHTSDVADLDKEILARAALAAGKDAAKRKLDEVLGDEAPEKDAPKDEKSSKSRRWKIAIIAVLVLALGIGLVGLMISYWQWFLAAGVVGLAALYGYYRWRRRKRDTETEAEAEAPARAAKEEPKARVAPLEDQDEVALRALEREKAARERARQAEAAREARAQMEQEVDDELAAMKARLKK
jgi:hypothetical protein